MTKLAQGSRDDADEGVAASKICLEATRQLASSDREMRFALAEIAQQVDLNETQLLVLHCCATKTAGCGISQTDLAGLIGVSPAQISDTVDRLRRKQLIAGVRSPEDRRRQLWCATDAGRDCHQSILSRFATWANSLQSQLNDDDLATLAAVLGRLTFAARAANADVVAATNNGQVSSTHSSRKVA